MVLITAAVGHIAGTRSLASEPWIAPYLRAFHDGGLADLGQVLISTILSASTLSLILTLVGTGLAAGSANALNQLWERRRDGRMDRTRNRPIPTGRISPGHAFLFGIALAYGGTAILAMGTNLVAAGLAIANVLAYVLIYTPLKPRTTLNTLVGAVCGAVPPMIGWSAATGGIETGAWVLAAILFVWQIPHFLSLAWMYRDDYARGGFRMLPSHDPDGTLTGIASVCAALLLAPLCLLAVLAGAGGVVFAFGGAALTVWFAWMTFRFLRDRTDQRARSAFFASLIFLPMTLILLVIDPTSPMLSSAGRDTIIWIVPGDDIQPPPL